MLFGKNLRVLATFIRSVIPAIAGKNGTYINDFAIVNKSYAKDLRWSVVMHRSWQRFATPLSPFFVIVPQDEVVAFTNAFEEDRERGRIRFLPTIISENWLFEITNISIPESFSGWHRQQVAKLCFAKSGLSRQYLTVDSSMLFTKSFDYRSLLNGAQTFTAAQPVDKAAFFSDLRMRGDRGWLDGALSGMEDCMQRICDVIGNSSATTGRYISCTGMFDSDLSRDLERFAVRKSLNGYVGLLQIAPYEFAWYGEFVHTRHRKRFYAHGPDLMTLVHSEQDVRRVITGEFSVKEHHLGAMFQPPASESLSVEHAYSALVDRRFR